MWKSAPRRLDKYLVDCRLGVRARCVAAIREGRVEVEGVPGAVAHTLVGCDDVVRLDGELVAPRPPQILVVLHKPAGILSAMSDVYGRECVGDLLPAQWEGRAGIVGRLDRATTGAVLVTDDGDLNEAIRAALPKTYRIDVEGEVSADQLRELREGVVISHVRRGLKGVSVKTLPADVDRVEGGLRMVLREGRNRQVRRMCAAVKVRLVHLHRESVGPVVCPPQGGTWSKVDPAVFDGLARLRIQRYADVLTARLGRADDRERDLIDVWYAAHPQIKGYPVPRHSE